ncbi:MAG TPA: hypothetical protein VEU47_18805 [Candidatus Cybelea sp.]|nr:hypothetical protein [Candidatus Cybelea sp.]
MSQSAARTERGLVASEISAPVVPSVGGYIDTIQGNRVFGWAWDPKRPTARIVVQVEVAGEVTSSVTADRAREDLKANGVGDGAHAFECDLPADASEKDIRILALCPETRSAVELLARPAARPGEGADNTVELRQAMQMLNRSQRQVQRNLQSALAAVEELRRDAAGQDASKAEAAVGMLTTRLQAMESAVMRIDKMLREQTDRRDKPEAAAGGERVMRILVGLALLLSGGAFILALLR